MKDVLEVSYTGDLLSHRRCPRAWAYEKYARFQPYEQSQAMEGRLVHHAMEWMTKRFEDNEIHVTSDQLNDQLMHFFRVLWARGFRTTFESKQNIVGRVVRNLFPDDKMHKTVRAAIEGAKHTEYELRTVKKIMEADFSGKSKMMLTGVLDLVLQSKQPLTYKQTWVWDDQNLLNGHVVNKTINSKEGDLEVWDYKGSKAETPHAKDYVVQLLTYAGLYGERVGSLPARCVLFFVNEPDLNKQLIEIPIDKDVVERAEKWTINEAKRVRHTGLMFETDPMSVSGGDLDLQEKPIGSRVDRELEKQCTACGQRFDCVEYITHRGGPNNPDVDMTNVGKN